MTTGIVKTLEVMATVQDLAVRLVGISKSPTILSFFGAAPALFSDVRSLSEDASLVMPELLDLDPSEVGQLGTAAYQLVLTIVDALKK